MASTDETETLKLVEAVRAGLESEMERDDDVVLLGEDIGKNGGVFRATDGLYEEFGDDRVIDTPLSECGIVGTAIGLSLNSLRPVPELQFLGFGYPAFEQIINHAARMRSRSLGKCNCPLTIRTPYGGGIRAPEHHSESTEAFFAHYPGIKVVVPSTPANTKGLLTSAIRDPDPVMFLEPARIYRSLSEPVPTGEHTVPLGSATVRREGSDVSLFTWGAMVHETMDTAEALAAEGIECEVVDFQTLSPLDTDTAVGSLEKTGRGVVVHEAPRMAGLGAEIVSTLQEDALLKLEAPIERVTGFDVPFPLYQHEDYYLPGIERIADTVRRVVAFPEEGPTTITAD
ncbi:alpha-ketoacid dehydrogenase subunit beta [Natrinema gelatinilyticum]|uniref:alpha-ketoacid dehydrogenase subunit beta n=1 Tax=Natrinema gelatinilyticum TaxID=2961571 RepID=UPI0020C3FF68|nr:alpha-ketoacid dehydrogenase subunit beta [Natrinema gelatinilyticum]